MSCPGCGAALAEDQRYCLNCGQRRGEPRVDFRRHLDAAQTATKERGSAANGRGEPGAVAPPSVTPSPETSRRDYAPLAAVGGIAVLGIMLLIGVLIGRGTGSDQVTAPPQVVTVAQGASEGGSGTAAKKPADAAGKDQGGKKGAGKENAAAGGKTATDIGNAPVASDEQLEALQGKTGQEYAEESAKLPDEIATPGAAPPTDDKTPGGGSGGVTLE